MRSLVLLAVVGVCSAVPFLRDAPDVQAEKARFFEVFNAVQNAATSHPALKRPSPKVQPKWYGPVAATVPAGVDGTITPVGDTQEVNAARNAFFNAYNAQVKATVGSAPVVPSYAPTYSAAPAAPYQPAPVQPKWTGPVAATVPAGLPGSAPQVADTPEVAAAKQEFFNTFQRQAAAAAPPSRNYY
ncbi:cuticle protein CP1499 [Penaeus vannamei]|uniref:Calcified cuticle protein CP19.0 isoform A n=1 Tax=Penaeus vannamei TaxID=6689 RepID=A0A3R7MG76_PENVA|nr:cuticle protein CP1499-like [Penaeus vannamei]ROT80837.1 calcified cuticle protein CP19.0 isoform A [Penaeus vannamei]